MFIKALSALLLTSVVCLAENPLPFKINTADPSAKVWDGKLWLYPSHDSEAMTSYRGMQDWHVFSLEDGGQWTDHGIALSLDRLNNESGWDVYYAWAPDCERKNGTYYFYFPVKSNKDKKWYIGAATSTSPQGPFVDPVKIVSDWSIDPDVLVDDDGRAYLYCQDKMAELNDDMVSVKPETVVKFHDAVELPHPESKNWDEGPHVFKKDGKYYMLSTTKGFRVLIYAMSDKPLGPYEYKGVLMDRDPAPGNYNAHASVVEYNGKWILFYHRADKNKARKVCAEYLEFNEDGTIKKVKRTTDGVDFSKL